MNALGLAPGPEGMVTEPSQVLQSPVPLYETLVRNHQIPKMLPPTIHQPEPILEAADAQTAALCRVAQAMENSVALKLQEAGAAEWQATLMERLTSWVQLFVGIATLTPVVVAALMYVLR